MKKYLKSLCAGLTISTALVLVGNQVTYAEETNTTTQASPAATSESSTTTAPTTSTTTTTVTPTAPVTGTQSSPSAISTPYSTSVSTASSALTAVDNIVDIGSYVNVEGLPATLSEDGTGVTYSFTVAYQRMHTSDEGQTVSDLLIRIPNIDNADVKFTLIGTRDASGNPVDVNVPMSIVDYYEAVFHRCVQSSADIGQERLEVLLLAVGEFRSPEGHGGVAVGVGRLFIPAHAAHVYLHSVGILIGLVVLTINKNSKQ